MTDPAARLREKAADIRPKNQMPDFSDHHRRQIADLLDLLADSYEAMATEVHERQWGGDPMGEANRTPNLRSLLSRIEEAAR